MKTIFAFSLALLSLNLSAFEHKMSLDFTNLYGQTNAGAYETKVQFIPKTTISETKLSFYTRREDNDLICTTTATFEIGVMNFTLSNAKGWQKTITKTINASASVQSQDENCETDLAKFSGRQNLYAPIGLDEAITLPVKAPFEYKTVGVHLAPFNGYLTLDSSIEVQGDKLVLNPGALLTERSILATNVNNYSVTYFVFARNESSTLSLGTGLIKY